MQKNRLQIVIAYEKAREDLAVLYNELEGFPVRSEVRKAMSFLEHINQLEFVRVFERLQ